MFEATDWNGNQVVGHSVMNEGIYTWLVTDSGRILVDCNSVEEIPQKDSERDFSSR